MAEKKVTEKKAEEKKVAKPVVDFDSTKTFVQSLLDTEIAKPMVHKDEFKLVSVEGKTVCYFHIRKHSIDVYVPDSMDVLKEYERFKSPCRNYSRIYVNDGAELFAALTTIYDKHLAMEKKKAAEAEKAKAEKKPAAKKKSAEKK